MRGLGNQEKFYQFHLSDKSHSLLQYCKLPLQRNFTLTIITDRAREMWRSISLEQLLEKISEGNSKGRKNVGEVVEFE